MHKEWRDVAIISWEGLVLLVRGEGPQARPPEAADGGRSPPKTARRAVWPAAPCRHPAGGANIRTNPVVSPTDLWYNRV